MEDEVKITVIATGFERDHLPELNRRGDSLPQLQPVPVPEPRIAEPAPPPAMTPLFETPEHILEEAPPPPPPVEQPAIAATDLEIPAYLRRERRLYQ